MAARRGGLQEQPFEGERGLEAEGRFHPFPYIWKGETPERDYAGIGEGRILF